MLLWLQLTLMMMMMMLLLHDFAAYLVAAVSAVPDLVEHVELDAQGPPPRF